jgi:hypothetical protein
MAGVATAGAGNSTAAQKRKSGHKEERPKTHRRHRFPPTDGPPDSDQLYDLRIGQQQVEGKAKKGREAAAQETVWPEAASTS